MLKKTLIAAATAGVLGLGMVAAASAAPNNPPPFGGGNPPPMGGQYNPPPNNGGVNAQFGGPGWSITIGNGQYNPYNQYQPRKFCQPITKKVKWWDRFGYPHWSVVVVGQKCPPQFPPKFPPHGPYNPGPFPQPGPGPFPGPGPYHPGPWGW
jgi:hypothetical protein